MDKTKQPGIEFNGIILVKEEFWRDYDVPRDSKIHLDLEAGNIEMQGDYSVEVNSTLILTKEDKEVLTLKSKFIGFFSTVKGKENMDIEEYVKYNSVALMFPYIREHISAITVKSGIEPIFLPPVNVVALLEKNET